ncbi:hypothetical protein R1flu_005544 [Riccia fluitans]|uniref:Uncharacterized protein n=1 Tax=Riccia fluitans TaxID=41844 RepID=A0ABD1YTQ5_9MARC
MTTRRHQDLGIKEVKIPQLTNENRKKLKAWHLGGLFSADWSQSYEDLESSSNKWKGPPTSQFCQLLNSVLAPMRPEYFQYNQLAFYHYAWLGISNPSSLMPDWRDAVEKTMTNQVKELGVCNEPTYLGPYLAHLYLHFNKLHNENMKGQNKQKARK